MDPLRKLQRADSGEHQGYAPGVSVAFIDGLRWVDVNPEVHTLDVERVERIVTSLVPAKHLRGAKNVKTRYKLFGDINLALQASEGPWIAAWRWSAGEHGGIVHVEPGCTEYNQRSTPEAIVKTVLSAVIDYREKLEELSRRFACWDEVVDGLDDGQAAARIASQVLPLVLKWNDAEDAWYSAFCRILSWALERRGLEPKRAEFLVSDAIGGRFESWLRPTEAMADRVFADLRSAVDHEKHRPPRDALAEWITTREKIAWVHRQSRCDPNRVEEDGHRRFIEKNDASRNPERADRLHSALTACRADARANVPLNLERLTEWQTLVLGAPAPFRTSEAYAHGGTERYGLQSDTKERFEACLEEANDETIPVISRAARVYLDVCCFHPFADGNARAARLALDFVLTRAGLWLKLAAPVFLVARRADDRWGPYAFMHTIEYLCGPIDERA